MPSWAERSKEELDQALPFEPTDAEIEAWASSERQRRARWLSGPTPEEAAVWASHELERRTRALEGALQARGPRSGPSPSTLAQHSLRTAQLAAKGAMSLLFQLSLRDA